MGYTTEQITSGVRQFTEKVYNTGPASSISANLMLEQDAANVNMGGNWRMPTNAEYQELLNNCDGMWTDDYNETGVAGRVFTSRVNGNSVFFPTAGYSGNSSVGQIDSHGYYWASSWYSYYNAWILFFHSGNQSVRYTERYSGQSVRGVCE